MINSRRINADDYLALKDSLSKDEYHVTTTPEFFYEEGTCCNVYEDDAGIVLFIRGKIIDGTSAVRLDVQFLNNRDVKRNAKTMNYGFQAFAEQLKAVGFTALVFDSDNPLLTKFCVKRFEFEHNDGILIKLL